MAQTIAKVGHWAAALAFALALGGCASGGVERADAPPEGAVIDATDPAPVLAIARRHGAARLETHESGNPLIRARSAGVKYFVVFDGCADGVDCRDLQFFASWTNLGATLASVNAHNATRLLGKAYLRDDGQVVLQMGVNLHRGVTSANLDDAFRRWDDAIAGFLEGHAARGDRG